MSALVGVEVGLKVWRGPVWPDVPERPPETMTWTPSMHVYTDFRQRGAEPQLVAQLNPDGTLWVDWPLVEKICAEHPLSASMAHPQTVSFHMLLALRDRLWADKPWSEVVDLPQAPIGEGDHPV